MQSRPTLHEITAPIQADLARVAKIETPLKKASILSALSFALSGAIHLLYGRLEYLFNQLSNPSGSFLEAYCNFFGIKRHDKTKASATVKFIGTVGKVIEKNSLLSHDDGRTYKLIKSVEIGENGTSFGTVEAQMGGKIGNLKDKEALTLIESVANVTSKVQVMADNLTPGFDTESDEDLKDRLFSHLRNPGQGGTEEDYKKWAKEIPGVGRVWVTNRDESHHVYVTFLTSDFDFPIPNQKHRDSVSESLLKKKPLGTRVSVYALNPITIPIEISLSPEMSSLVPKIEAALKMFFLKQVEPESRVTLFMISQVISQITKAGNYKIDAPANDISMGAGQIAVFGGLTWKTIL